jgi:hypothetical protein
MCQEKGERIVYFEEIAILKPVFLISSIKLPPLEKSSLRKGIGSNLIFCHN